MTTAPLRLLVVGYGRMGRLVEALAGEYAMEVSGRVDIDNAGEPETWPDADIAVDFSTASAVVSVRSLRAHLCDRTCWWWR